MVLCEVCKKRVATLHITEIMPDGTKRMVHLCEECARSEGMIETKQTPHTLQQLLQQVMEQHMGEVRGEISKLKCPKCGITYEEFRRNRKFGCPEDYRVFEDALVEMLERLHGASHHRGKEYKSGGEKATKASKVLMLKQRLAEAVKREEYEEAARIRDEIKRLQEEEDESKKKR